MLKYLNGAILKNKVPDETSLVIILSGCMHKCPECDIKYAWTEEGKPLLKDIPLILETYKKYISCLCLVGGDHEQAELTEVFRLAHSLKLKTCLYSGYEEMSPLSQNLLKELNYLKLGRLDKAKGSLSSVGTNLRMYMKDYSPFGDAEDWVDITFRFRE